MNPRSILSNFWGSLQNRHILFFFMILITETQRTKSFFFDAEQQILCVLSGSVVNKIASSYFWIIT